MSESEAEPADADAEAGDAAARDESDVTGEHATRRTDERHSCRRCGREQGLVGKYDIWLCRQCFREVARDMGFKKYR